MKNAHLVKHLRPSLLHCHGYFAALSGQLREAIKLT